MILFLTDVNNHSDRAQSVETLLSPTPHPPLSAKSSNNAAGSLSATVSSINPSLDHSTMSQKTSQDPASKIASVLSGLSGTSGSNSASTDSERTYRVDSQDSQVSDTETSGDRHWPRQNSVNYSIKIKK